jgi:hypothetical protein
MLYGSGPKSFLLIAKATYWLAREISLETTGLNEIKLSFLCILRSVLLLLRFEWEYE